MKQKIAEIIRQFEEIKPEIRVDASQKVAVLSVALVQAFESATEVPPADPLQTQLDAIASKVEEIRAAVVPVL